MLFVLRYSIGDTCPKQWNTERRDRQKCASRGTHERLLRVLSHTKGAFLHGDVRLNSGGGPGTSGKSKTAHEIVRSQTSFSVSFRVHTRRVEAESNV